MWWDNLLSYFCYEGSLSKKETYHHLYEYNQGILSLIQEISLQNTVRVRQASQEECYYNFATLTLHRLFHRSCNMLLPRRKILSSMYSQSLEFRKVNNPAFLSSDSTFDCSHFLEGIGNSVELITFSFDFYPFPIFNPSTVDFTGGFVTNLNFFSNYFLCLQRSDF